MQRYESYQIEKEEIKNLLDFLYQRFGIPSEVFDSFVFVRRAKNIYITTQEYVDIALAMRPEIPGLRAFTPWHHSVKPTTDFIQTFGIHATKNTLHISMERIEDFFSGKFVPDITGIDPGFVIITTDLGPLGVGYISARGEFINMIPRERRRIITGD